MVKLARVAIVLLVACGSAALGGMAWAQEGEPQAAPTPVSTRVTPGIVTVVPEQTVVVPVQSAAGAETESADTSLRQEGPGGNLFTGVRGGLIGSGIGFGAVLVLAVAVAAAKRGLRRLRQ